MQQIGPLPVTGQIQFEFDENQFKMLQNRLINEVLIDATISFPHNPSKGMKKIKITMKKAFGPGNHITQSHTVGYRSSDMNESTMSGLGRAQNYLLDEIIVKNSWLLFGTVHGSNNLPIIIIFLKEMKYGTYSFKKKDEDAATFNPALN